MSSLKGSVLLLFCQEKSRRPPPMRRKRNCEIKTRLIRSLRYGRDDGLVGADDGLVGWHLLNGRCGVNEKISRSPKSSFRNEVRRCGKGFGMVFLLPALRHSR